MLIDFAVEKWEAEFPLKGFDVVVDLRITLAYTEQLRCFPQGEVRSCCRLCNRRYNNLVNCLWQGSDQVGSSCFGSKREERELLVRARGVVYLGSTFCHFILAV